MVIHFKPNNLSTDVKNISKLENYKYFFSNKRKMINKNIRKILTQDQINSIKSLNLNLRPSEIKPEIYYKITQICQNIRVTSFINLNYFLYLFKANI